MYSSGSCAIMVLSRIQEGIEWSNRHRVGFGIACGAH